MQPIDLEPIIGERFFCNATFTQFKVVKMSFMISNKFAFQNEMIIGIHSFVISTTHTI